MSFGDWLGTDAISPWKRQYRSFNDARSYARSLGLKTQMAWTALRKEKRLPPDIPGTPDRVYAGGGWQGWSDWLGTPVIANLNREFLPFVEARAFVRKLGLKTAADWRDYVGAKQRPRDIPSAPYNTYKEKGWIDWGDWLGTGRKRQSSLDSSGLPTASKEKAPVS